MFCGPDLAFESKYFLKEPYGPLLGAKLLTSDKRHWREIAAHGPLPALVSVLDQAPWLICPTTKSRQNKTFPILGFKKSGYFKVSLLYALIYACLIFFTFYIADEAAQFHAVRVCSS